MKYVIRVTNSLINRLIRFYKHAKKKEILLGVAWSLILHFD